MPHPKQCRVNTSHNYVWAANQSFIASILLPFSFGLGTSGVASFRSRRSLVVREGEGQVLAILGRTLHHDMNDESIAERCSLKISTGEKLISHCFL